ncbi:MAG TPA: nuclear transport factor 2 family protein [Acidimicrobiia bacterium]|jgi:uncharacterized protein (TIGR02246 family)
MSTRPELECGGPRHDDATAAVAVLVAELQAGWDRHDADITDGSLAGDVLWGSPYGMTVTGYDELHAIHVRLKQEGRGGARARFEVVDVRAPVPDVAIAHVRRHGLEGEPGNEAFSEMALYVLVRRDGKWWLAAGQNTPIASSVTGAGAR